MALYCVWQSPWGKWWLAHWASLLRWIWSISEYNLWLGTPRNGPLRLDHYDRERRGSGPAKQKPKHNPCRPVGRNWKVPIMTTWPSWREITGTWTPECLARADLIGWIPKGIPKRLSKMWSGIVHHKSDRKSCVLPTADRNIVLRLNCYCAIRVKAREYHTYRKKETNLVLEWIMILWNNG